LTVSAVYTIDNYSGRVSHAAAVITRGGETNRNFDTCFEMYDGDAVATALYRKSLADPDGPLARNLWRYLGRETVEATAKENTRRTNLAQWARELREAGEQASAKQWAKMREDQEARNAAAAQLPADPEAELRALWTAQGVTQERQEEVLAEITAKAQPGAQVGPFKIPYRTQLTKFGEQYMIPGTEPEDRPKTAQLSLF
jgi:hypothetical protein